MPPDGVPIIRTSERVLFKRCQMAWRWSYREGLKPKRVADALWFGELVHISLAAWYCGPGTKRGPEPVETFLKLYGDEVHHAKVADATEEEVAKYVEMKEMGEVLLDLYVKEYGTDDRWLVIAPEQTFALEIPFPDWWGEDTRRWLARYVGTFDLVFRDAATGLLWLGEHKTARAVSTDHLTLDEQAGGYWAVAYRSLLAQKLIKSNERLAGIMYNFIRKGLPDARPRDAQGYYLNQNGSRSKQQPKPLFVRHQVRRTRAERVSILNRVQADAVQMELARRGEVPLTKTPHRSCKFCEHFNLCQLHEASGNYQDLKKIAYNVQDPYAAHRKSTEDDWSFEHG